MVFVPNFFKKNYKKIQDFFLLRKIFSKVLKYIFWKLTKFIIYEKYIFQNF